MVSFGRKTPGMVLSRRLCNFGFFNYIFCNEQKRMIISLSSLFLFLVSTVIVGFGVVIVGKAYFILTSNADLNLVPEFTVKLQDIRAIPCFAFMLAFGEPLSSVRY